MQSAMDLYEAQQWIKLDVSNRAVEESASIIIEMLGDVLESRPNSASSGRTSL